MSDFDTEYLLLDAVAEFRLEASPFVHPSGTQAVRATVLRRRQTRIAAVAAVVVVLILAPMAAFAALTSDRRAPQPGGPTTSASPTASATASPSKSASPTATPTAPASTAETPIDLSDATFSVGDWPTWSGADQICPTGSVAFVGGKVAAANGKSPLYLFQTAAIDVDHDGHAETVAIIGCADSQVEDYQVVAVKPGPGGSVKTLGQVARSSSDARDIKEVVAGPDGQVDLTVGDIVPCCAIPLLTELTQVRGFAWTGTAFHQVAGPTTFTADRTVADLTTTTSPVRFGPLANRVRAATFTLTLHNNGPQAAPAVSVMVELPPFSIAAPAGGATCSAPSRGSGDAYVCQLGDLAAGATATLTLNLTETTTDSPTIDIQPRTGNQKYDTLHLTATYG
jgi:hypothetical protein